MVDLEVLGINLISSWVYGSLLMLVSVSLTLVFGLGRVINFAIGVFYALGAFFALSLIPIFGYWPSLVIIPVMLVPIGALIERVTIQPIRARPEIYTLLVTFALAALITGVIQVAWDPRTHLLDPPVSGSLEILGSSYPKFRLVGAAIATLTGVAIWVALHATTAGIRIRGASENGVMASMLGVDTAWTLSLVFALSVGISGLAGVLAGPMFSVRSVMGNDFLIDAFLAVVIGGLGSLRGAILGSYVVGIVKNVPIAYMAADWATALVFGVVILVLLFRPRGVFGEGRVD